MPSVLSINHSLIDISTQLLVVLLPHQPSTSLSHGELSNHLLPVSIPEVLSAAEEKHNEHGICATANLQVSNLH